MGKRKRQRKAVAKQFGVLSVDEPRLKEPTGRAPKPTEEIGTTGLEIYSGRIYEEFLPSLQSPRRRVNVFKEMRDNDPTVGAMLFAIEMLIRQVDWRIEPASDDPKDLEAAEFLESCIEDMAETWDDTISQILSFLPFGYSIHEEVYKIRRGRTKDPATTSKEDDGRVGWRKIAPRAQETIEQWIYDENMELRGVVQRGPPDWQIHEIPAERFLLFRSSTYKNNPEGKSILRNAYRPWWFKKRIEEIEGIGIERDLAGLPTALVPPELLRPNATPEQKALLNEIKTIIRNIRRDQKEGVVFPLARDDAGNLTYELKLLSTGGRRQFDTSTIITRWDRRIAQVVLADFILLGGERVGSFALADSKTELFAIAIGAWLGAIAEQLNRVAIPRLFRLNTFDTENGFPEIMHGDIESLDIEKLADYMQKLASAGMPLFPDEALERDLRGRAGLPMPDEMEREAAIARGETAAENRQAGGRFAPKPDDDEVDEPDDRSTDADDEVDDEDED